MKSIAQTDQSVNQKSAEGFSAELLAANQRLLEMRRKHQSSRTPRPEPAPLPAHLGWGSAALTQVLRAAEKREQAAKEAASPLLLETVTPVTSDPTPDPAPTRPTEIKVYPSLLTAILGVDLASAGRIWLLCRAIDLQGRGWLTVEDLRAEVCGKTSALKVCGWRRLRQILKEGNDLFWQRDAQGRLWLRSSTFVAATLGVVKMTGKPVYLPLSVLTSRMSVVKAHFYASYHSGRISDGWSSPISRATLSVLTDVPERTQRHYEKVAKIKTRSCIALGQQTVPGESSAEKEENLWLRGHALFTFTDFQGKQGRAGRSYFAWQLPNQYKGCHKQAPQGRQRKINRILKDLVTSRARGNVEQSEKIERVFFDTGRGASNAQLKRERGQVYCAAEPINNKLFWFTFSAG